MVLLPFFRTDLGNFYSVDRLLISFSLTPFALEAFLASRREDIPFFWKEEKMRCSYDLLCFSHLRWNFVFQRPQHLLSRCAMERRVFFIEEPLFDENSASLEVSMRSPTLYIVVPHLPLEVQPEEAVVLQQNLLDELFSTYGINTYVAWYFTPMALAFSGYLEPLAVVYDCMDELSAFNNASPLLKQRETELLAYADLVFTGGQSLYEAKRYRHPRVYAFPSAVDSQHFIQARNRIVDPADQEDIRHPRLGFYGVIDERLNTALLAEIADAQPNWNLVLIGPIVKIKPETLPKGDNIHYLGKKSYEELPSYLAGWDVALIPFAHNQSTRFISPTKTLEYLAAGKPVVSTSIHDVVYPYGQQGLVTIADTPQKFIAAVNKIVKQQALVPQQKIDELLVQTSWDSTWKRMSELIEDVVAVRSDWPSYSVTSVTSLQPQFAGNENYLPQGGIK